MRSVGDNKQLHILIQTACCPEAIPLVTLNLIKRFFQSNATAFQFDMYQRKSIHQNGHIVAVIVVAAVLHILIDDLQGIVMDVLLIYQSNVLAAAIITL